MPANFVDLTGLVFGELTVIGRAPSRGWVTWWSVRCNCGTQKEVAGGNLRSGGSRSCGCKRREFLSKAKTRHGQANSRINGRWATTTYRAWTAMLSRCYNRHAKAFPDYGGRGITVCSRWLESFDNFLADMGERPRGLSLERKDNSMGYSPANCEWATARTQGRNTRRNKKYTLNGETLCLAEWSERAGLAHSVIQGRLRRGWSLERALTEAALPNDGKSKKHAVILTFDGVTDTLSGWARRTGIDVSCLARRVKSGWSVERALTTPPRP